MMVPVKGVGTVVITFSKEELHTVRAWETILIPVAKPRMFREDPEAWMQAAIMSPCCIVNCWLSGIGRRMQL